MPRDSGYNSPEKFKDVTEEEGRARLQREKVKHGRSSADLREQLDAPSLAKKIEERGDGSFELGLMKCIGIDVIAKPLIKALSFLLILVLTPIIWISSVILHLAKTAALWLIRKSLKKCLSIDSYRKFKNNVRLWIDNTKTTLGISPDLENLSNPSAYSEAWRFVKWAYEKSKSPIVWLFIAIMSAGKVVSSAGLNFAFAKGTAHDVFHWPRSEDIGFSTALANGVVCSKTRVPSIRDKVLAKFNKNLYSHAIFTVQNMDDSLLRSTLEKRIKSGEIRPLTFVYIEKTQAASAGLPESITWKMFFADEYGELLDQEIQNYPQLQAVFDGKERGLYRRIKKCVTPKHYSHAYKIIDVKVLPEIKEVDIERITNKIDISNLLNVLKKSNPKVKIDEITIRSAIAGSVRTTRDGFDTADAFDSENWNFNIPSIISAICDVNTLTPKDNEAITAAVEAALKTVAEAVINTATEAAVKHELERRKQKTPDDFKSQTILYVQATREDEQNCWQLWGIDCERKIRNQEIASIQGLKKRLEDEGISIAEDTPIPDEIKGITRPQKSFHSKLLSWLFNIVGSGAAGLVAWFGTYVLLSQLAVFITTHGVIDALLVAAAHVGTHAILHFFLATMLAGSLTALCSPAGTLILIISIIFAASATISYLTFQTQGQRKNIANTFRWINEQFKFTTHPFKGNFWTKKRMWTWGRKAICTMAIVGLTFLSWVPISGTLIGHGVSHGLIFLFGGSAIFAAMMANPVLHFIILAVIVIAVAATVANLIMTQIPKFYRLLNGQLDLVKPGEKAQTHSRSWLITILVVLGIFGGVDTTAYSTGAVLGVYNCLKPFMHIPGVLPVMIVIATCAFLGAAGTSIAYTVMFMLKRYIYQLKTLRHAKLEAKLALRDSYQEMRRHSLNKAIDISSKHKSVIQDSKSPDIQYPKETFPPSGQDNYYTTNYKGNTLKILRYTPDTLLRFLATLFHLLDFMQKRYVKNAAKKSMEGTSTTSRLYQWHQNCYQALHDKKVDRTNRYNTKIIELDEEMNQLSSRPNTPVSESLTPTSTMSPPVEEAISITEAARTLVSEQDESAPAALSTAKPLVPADARPTSPASSFGSITRGLKGEDPRTEAQAAQGALAASTLLAAPQPIQPSRVRTKSSPPRLQQFFENGHVVGRDPTPPETPLPERDSPKAKMRR